MTGLKNKTYWERRLSKVVETVESARIPGTDAKKIALDFHTDGCVDIESAFDILDKFASFVAGNFRYSEVKWLVPPETDYVLFNAAMKLELSCVC